MQEDELRLRLRLSQMRSDSAGGAWRSIGGLAAVRHLASRYHPRACLSTHARLSLFRWVLAWSVQTATDEEVPPTARKHTHTHARAHTNIHTKLIPDVT